MTPASPIAETLASKQKDISVAEFFERNKQILGFDSLTKSVITSVKEAVDNALDACEEAGILPEISVELRAVDKTEYRMIVEDNGPGIVRRAIPNVFGRLLHGSRFHSIRQSRGQQGIGISAVVMYSQLTTGNTTVVRSKVLHEDLAHEIELILDTKKNRPEKIRESPVVWKDKEHGTRIEMSISGRVTRGKQSVGEYIRQTAIVNPHARLVYKDPFGNVDIYERSTSEAPCVTQEVKPHPMGTELGTLMKMMKATKSRTITGFLHTEFSSVSHSKAKEICEVADLNAERSPKRLSIEDTKKVLESFSKVKLRSPDTSCLSPIGSRLIRMSLRNVLGELRPEFYSPPVSRPPKVSRGHPFQIEAGLVYGGDIKKEGQVEILRFANRVPLLYQQGACATTRALERVDWRKYGLEQRGGSGIPLGPAIILVHIASTKVPFTSESKEAVANIDDITMEVERAIRECGRKLRLHLSKRKRRGKVQEKFDIAQQIIPHIAAKCSEMLDKPVPDITRVMTKVMDVVQIIEDIEYDKKSKITNVKIIIKNYRPSSQNLTTHAVLPTENIMLGSMDPKPKEKGRGGRYTWEIKRLSANSEAVINFKLVGLAKDEYDETEFYVEGVDASHLLGSEPLPGDWDLDDVAPKRTSESTLTLDEEDEEEEEEEDELDDDEPIKMKELMEDE